MVVSTSVVARRYEDVSAGTPISVDIPAYEAGDIYVYYGKASAQAIQDVDYTVTLAGDFETFTVTPTSSLLTKINALIAADATEENFITVRRTLDYLTDATPDGVRYTPFTSREFDRNAMRDQQLKDQLARALTFPPAQLAEDVDGSVVNVEPGQFIRRSDDGTQFNGASLALTVSQVDAWFQNRDTTAATQAALLTDGSIVSLNGLAYRVDSSATGSASATNDLGVDGLVPHGQWYFEHFGAPLSPTDCRAACQRAIDATPTGRRIMFATPGPYRTTGAIYLKKMDMQISGPHGGDALMEYVNAAGGTVFAGDEDEDASLAAYSRCKIEGIQLRSVDAATDPSRVVDLTSFSYGYFYVKGQTKRTDAEWYYGQGNAGTAPYWNTIIIDGVFGGDGAGGTNYTQTALRFAQGAWAGGSNGGNANTIRCQGRAAALRGVIDIQSGTGNMIEVLNAESINDWYVRLNFNPSVESGTSSGSNGQVTLIDTAKSWTTNQFLNDAVKITSGTGAGQVRMISTNTGTTLNLKEPWGIVPDATSTYEIYESKASGNQVSLARAEGLASLNPDFIQAHPGTTKTNFAFSEVQSLGTGLFVRDDSGSPDNNWFNGDKLVFTHTFENPGPGANINAYPRVSVFGGLQVPGTFAVEWLRVNNSYTGSGDVADVRLDVGGIAPGNGDMTLHAQMPSGNTVATALPGPTQKINRDGTNRSLFLNLQTGASFSATVDVQATFCISLT